MTLLSRAVKSGATIAIAAAMLTASAGFTAALVGSEGAPKIKPQSGNVTIAFDWRAGKPGTRAATVVSVSSKVSTGLNLGGGSYVCSPAGFGHQSSCFSR
ncbi:hypothetical protein [Phaeovulum sp.]|uniref:hypothetical protein n=1 Tax=Phaeovulum sp. TaxID=2934796 RepID=UPI003564C86D